MTTPFKDAGYTKDTKFRVLVEDPGYGMRTGDIVWLKEDDESAAPEFTNGRDSRYFSILVEDAQLKVLSDTAYSQHIAEPTITHNLTIKGTTHVLTTEELVGVWSIINRIIVGD